MPTRKGVPKKGDRVMFCGTKGTVLRRGTGTYWMLEVRWDNGRTVKMPDAAYYFVKGSLKLIEE